MTAAFITITHLEDFNAVRLVNPGDTLILRKEPSPYDDESITVYSENGAKYGYVANSCARVARGTHSAGYICRDFDQEARCIVRFRLDETAIAELMQEEGGVNDH